MMRWRPPIKREPLGVTTRRNVATLRSQISDPAQLARFDANFPESRLPALPKPRIRRADGKPITANEHQEQAAVIKWWRIAHGLYKLPVFALFSVPNGAHLYSAHIAYSLLQSEGMRPGAPDLILAKPNRKYAGLYIEMKKIGGAKPSTEQAAFIEYLLSVGYLACVHYGAESAIEAIKSYLGYDEAMALAGG